MERTAYSIWRLMPIAEIAIKRDQSFENLRAGPATMCAGAELLAARRRPPVG
jgi:hypothetical protein